MTAKIKPYDRLKLIKKVERGEPVTRVCRQAGISRQVFYKWQRRYKKNKNVASLAPKGGTPDDWSFYNKLSPRERLSLIERVKSGENVVKVTNEYNVSRQLFYKWLKRYEEAPIGQKLEALWDKKPKIARYFNQAPEEYEEAVLSAVVQYPQLSSHRLVDVLPKVGNKPILANHGVYNILRRHSLTTYQQRQAYAESQIKATGFRYLFQPVYGVLNRLVELNPAARIFTIRFGFIFLISVFSAVVFWGLIGFVKLISASPSIAFSLGTIFSLVSLLFGMFFFLYSLKYYLIIAIVLSFSRRLEVNEGQGDIISPFLKAFGFYNKTIRAGSKSEEKMIGAGLYPDISDVKLGRQPFISVHVALYNEKRVVERLLTALTSFAYENYEIVIADDSTDETQDLLSTWSNHPRIKISHRDSREGFKGGALREALKVTDPKAEFVIIFDADFIPYPDTITQFLKYFQSAAGTLDFKKAYSLQSTDYSRKTAVDSSQNAIDSRIAAIQGYQWHVLNKSENWVTRGVRSEYAGSYVIERSGEEIYQGLKQISGSVYMIRRDVLEGIGWGTSITEDFQLTLKLYAAGYKVVYTPYVQAPAEAVSTIKRLIRQRMRWAEGHSHNIRKMFVRLLFGHWQLQSSVLGSQFSDIGSPVVSQSVSDKLKTGKLDSDNRQQRTDNRVFVPSPLSLSEKLEFIYLSPYYLQAAFFIAGTLSWFIAEVIFRVRLPFWTEIWGWSLIFTNMLALPLMNMVGLFLEESEEKDYLGLFSFVVLSYVTAPFQAYAAVKGFLAKEEGPWFRTPKTGRITDVFTPGRFYRFVFGVFRKPAFAHGFGEAKPAPAMAMAPSFHRPSSPFGHLGGGASLNPYLAFASANNQFQNFRIRRRSIRWAGNLVLIVFLLSTLLLTSLAPFIPQSNFEAQASERQFAVLSNTAQSDSSNRDSGKGEEISEPILVQFKAGGGKYLEYIFHPEPRVRTKFSGKEIEMTLVEAKGLGKARPRKSFHENGKYLYEEIFKDVDLRYLPQKGTLKEELILKKYTEINSIDYSLKVQDLAVALLEGEVQFAPKEGGKPIFTFARPYMYEEKNPQAKNFGVEYILEEKPFGFKLKKVVTEGGKKWLSDPSRIFPVILDPTVYNNVIQASVTETEARYGSNQRKLVYSSTAAAWYTVYDDGADVFFEKCAKATCQSGGWTNRTDLDTSDADNRHPDAWIEGDNIWVAWIDNGEDGIEFRPINTASSDALGTQCVGPDTGTLAPATYIVSIAVADDGDVFTAFADTSTDTELGVYRVAAASLSNCGDTTNNGTNWNTITGDSGLTAGDRPVLVTTGNNLHMIFQDGQLSHSAHDGTTTTTWSTANTQISSGTDTDFSAATDGTDVWVLEATGATGANLWKCSACPISSPTWSDMDDPWASQSNGSYVSITYVTTGNKIAAHLMRGTAGTDEQVYSKSSDADTISWGGETTLGFTSNSLDHLSSLMIAPTEDEVAVVALDPTQNSGELEFSTVPENIFLLLLLLPFLPRAFRRLSRRRPISVL